MVAGEASGDLLAGLLLEGMRARWPDLRAGGIGGPDMARRGFEPWWPHDKLAVRGYVEVLRHYREIVGIRQQLLQRLLRERPEVFIGVDAPDFNLDLEAGLKARGLNLSPGRGEESGLHGAAKVPGGYLGVADPRREGVAIGF